MRLLRGMVVDFGCLFGIEIDDALAILAAFKRILTLKDDISLGLQFHVASRASAA